MTVQQLKYILKVAEVGSISVDSIDEAIRAGVMTLGSEQIIVKLVPTENQIVISDNGLGIPA